MAARAIYGQKARARKEILINELIVSFRGKQRASERGEFDGAREEEESSVGGRKKATAAAAAATDGRRVRENSPTRAPMRGSIRSYAGESE